jgi:hypothetical protein
LPDDADPINDQSDDNTSSSRSPRRTQQRPRQCHDQHLAEWNSRKCRLEQLPYISVTARLSTHFIGTLPTPGSNLLKRRENLGTQNSSPGTQCNGSTRTSNWKQRNQSLESSTLDVLLTPSKQGNQSIESSIMAASLASARQQRQTSQSSSPEFPLTPANRQH